MRAAVYSSEGNYSATLADETKAIEVAPFVAASYKQRGRSHFNHQRYSDWLSDLAKSVELDPNDADGIQDIALFARRSSDESLRNRGLEILERTIQFARDKSGALVARARSYAAIGRFEDGLADLRAAQQQVPHRGAVETYGVQFYIENASELAKRDLWDSALEDSERILVPGNGYWTIRNCGQLAWLLAASRDVNVQRHKQSLHFAKIATDSTVTPVMASHSLYTQNNANYTRSDERTIDAVGVPHAYAARGWLALQDGRMDDAKSTFAVAASSRTVPSRFCYLYRALTCLTSGDVSAYQEATATELEKR